jgi:hypothetical protein
VLRTTIVVASLYSASFVVGSATHLLAGSITYDALNRPTLIPAVDITGEGVFDVVVRYGSFPSVFGSGNPPSLLTPLFWGNSSGAHTAATAISQALNDDGPRVPLIPVSEIIFYIEVPFRYDPVPEYMGWTDAQIAYIYLANPNPMYASDGSAATSPRATGDFFAWATFQVVPEPTTLTLLGTAIVMLGAHQLRRWRKRFATMPYNAME